METLEGKFYLLTNKMTRQFVENNLWRVFRDLEFLFIQYFPRDSLELYQVTFIQFKIGDVQTRMFFDVWHVQSLQVQFLLIGFSDYTFKHCGTVGHFNFYSYFLILIISIWNKFEVGTDNDRYDWTRLVTRANWSAFPTLEKPNITFSWSIFCEKTEIKYLFLFLTFLWHFYVL